MTGPRFLACESLVASIWLAERRKQYQTQTNICNEKRRLIGDLATSRSLDQTHETSWHCPKTAAPDRLPADLTTLDVPIRDAVIGAIQLVNSKKIPIVGDRSGTSEKANGAICGGIRRTMNKEAAKKKWIDRSQCASQRTLQIIKERRVMRSILVPVGGSETDLSLFETALAAARPTSGHLQFVHVHIGAGRGGCNMPHTEFAMAAALSNALKDLDVAGRTRSVAAAQHFRDFCRQSKIDVCDVAAPSQGVTASWHEETGRAFKRFLSRARHNDLIVIGRAKKGERIAYGFHRRVAYRLRAAGPDLEFDGATDPDRHHHGVLEGDRGGGPRHERCHAVSDQGQSRPRRQRGRKRRSGRGPP
jgi:hypothetical protein